MKLPGCISSQMTFMLVDRYISGVSIDAFDFLPFAETRWTDTFDSHQLSEVDAGWQAMPS